jgi:hypothetical protein
MSIFNCWQKANGELWMHAFFNPPVGQGWVDPIKLMNESVITNTPIAVTTWQYNDKLVGEKETNSLFIYTDTCHNRSSACSTNPHRLKASPNSVSSVTPTAHVKPQPIIPYLIRPA